MTKPDQPTTPAVVSVITGQAVIPVVIAAKGEKASERFFTFFTDNIRNRHTREAYFRNATRFFGWCESRNLTLAEIKSYHVSAYIEELMQTMAAPSVKQHLATIRMVFDWLIIGQVCEINPAQAVRGPKHVVKRGKTPVLMESEARQLLTKIDVSNVIGLRDRALIAVCLYSFARIEAALSMKVSDYYPQGKRWWISLHEKGGKLHDLPAHHKLEEYLDAYIDAAGLKEHKNSPLFRSAVGRTKTLSEKKMTRFAALRMVQRRAKQVGITTEVCCHSFRATGITNYLEHGGTLEKAQQMANHESPKTTKIYDRTNDAVTLDEIEKIAI
ncbi:MAG: tyrosine-type recombinase/integrase [bacterium]